MRQSAKQKSSNENARVKVGKLAPQDKELKTAEVENVRGGSGISGTVLIDQGSGGASGGVLGDKSDGGSGGGVLGDSR